MLESLGLIYGLSVAAIVSMENPFAKHVTEHMRLNNFNQLLILRINILYVNASILMT